MPSNQTKPIKSYTVVSSIVVVGVLTLCIVSLQVCLMNMHCCLIWKLMFCVFMMGGRWPYSWCLRRTRHAGHCWRSRDELVSDELLWTPTYGQAKAGRPAWTYIQQLCEDTGCSPEDQSGISVPMTWHDDDDVSWVQAGPQYGGSNKKYLLSKM